MRRSPLRSSAPDGVDPVGGGEATDHYGETKGGAMAQVERINGDGDPGNQRSTRGVPGDWFLDPADPDAARRYDGTDLDGAATAFLEAHAQPEEAELAPVTELPRRRIQLNQGDLADAGLLPSEAPTDLADGSELADGPDAPSEATGSHQVWIPLSGFLQEAEEGELGWQTEALCAQTDPEAFFPEKGGSTRDAKKVCSSCTVRAECLEYALANDERFGIWGGLSERERRRLRKRAN